jgi:precorrin-6A synthase
MRRVFIIGIGAGNPHYLTLQAIAALGATNTFFLPDKGEDKQALRAMREAMLDTHARPGHRIVGFTVPARDRSGAYGAGVDAWRAALLQLYREMIAGLGDDEAGAFLVWGDPALYDGTIAILDEVRAAGLDFELEVIPGISAVQALAARHGIPFNRVGETITVTTARRVRDGEADGLASFIVMLDSEAAWQRFADEPETTIHWGAYVGMPEEILVAGPIAAVGPEILRRRAAAREAHGWVMDSYLIRREPPPRR